MLMKYRLRILAVILLLGLSWPVASYLLEAAFFLSRYDSDDRVVYCINYENGHGFGDNPSSSKEWDDTFGRPVVLEAGDQLYSIQGNLGHHVTWIAILDKSLQPVKAYETYGAEGDATGAFGRSKIPSDVIKALKTCGIQFAGLWQGPLPWPQLNLHDLIPLSVD